MLLLLSTLIMLEKKNQDLFGKNTYYLYVKIDWHNYVHVLIYIKGIVRKQAYFLKSNNP